MAHNHRGQPIADPYLNARREALAEPYYDPEEEGYDEAFGPTDRTFRATESGRVGGGTVSSSQSDYDIEQGKMESRRASQGFY